MNVTETVLQGLKTIGIGIGVVFVVLGVFYLIIRAMMKIWPGKE